MGGQSFKCPHCEMWFLERHRFGAHIRGKHRYGFMWMSGVANRVLLAGPVFHHCRYCHSPCMSANGTVYCMDCGCVSHTEAQNVDRVLDGGRR